MRNYKIELRQQIKQKRSEMTVEEKQRKDRAIHRTICGLPAFKEAETILCFVSKTTEIDTSEMIKTAWAMGKKVAVPRCVPESKLMNFYYIEDFSTLEVGTYGLLEPIPNREKLYLSSGKKDFMVVPCLSCDSKGYRLGYGGGYYDRYLERFLGTTGVITYHHILFGHFWHGKYDLPCDLVISDRMIKYTGGRKIGKNKR